ncbi:indolepyruvate ferredoxin oxidoreductase subunit alpha [Natronincola ferrireducens]|uniref:2-oxoglutarate ferredoxin oxidoreductase subunit delta n=1 Tax=Natronincola ferrireducens TaxID=393762 RepID=A0A1G9C9F1_9FIRM|nr:4Fe-4S binding protein [Natronincola ferrireducens]SDK48281.1 2-oxoglutarate ferredoxin oxidoreductase subunit delta [Natronincola ferrireducens]
MANQKNNKELKIVKAWCKGCGICVEFCPVKILGLIDEKIHINDIDKCIKCGFCELRCPDYAIYLEEDKNEK